MLDKYCGRGLMSTMNTIENSDGQTYNIPTVREKSVFELSIKERGDSEFAVYNLKGHDGVEVRVSPSGTVDLKLDSDEFPVGATITADQVESSDRYNFVKLQARNSNQEMAQVGSIHTDKEEDKGTVSIDHWRSKMTLEIDYFLANHLVELMVKVSEGGDSLSPQEIQEDLSERDTGFELTGYEESGFRSANLEFEHSEKDIQISKDGRTIMIFQDGEQEWETSGSIDEPIQEWENFVKFYLNRIPSNVLENFENGGVQA